MREGMTPNSSKSTLDKTKEAFTDTADKIARGARTDHSKSTSQEMSDKMGRIKDKNEHGGSGHSVMDKAKNALGMDKH
ncbi:hypothetical protein LTR66_006036 [Elasticomyces elasticus]|nr:hypothetical protein LTR28_007794 [Elasticomyces elasticus]KAK4993379.1 hypothetical protein LTR66_006036 [Elasticomyces elasticus]